MKTQTSILTLSFFLILLICTLNSCKKEDCKETTPVCIEELIEHMNGIDECLSVVHKASSNLGTLYEFEQAGCFFWFFEYYDENCELVCSRGIGGLNTCQDLDTVYSRELIWERY